MGLNDNIPCIKSVPLSLYSCFVFPVSIAKHCISVLLYCVNAVAVRFLISVVELILTIPNCIKPLSITIFSAARVSFTNKKIKSKSIATQLKFTSVP